jgi:cation:H+ antiporter
MVVFLYLLLLGGALSALIIGSDWFVESSEKLGIKLGISPYVVGVTIVALGTSLPELASSITAILQEESSIVTGNVIGSNITNILLIVGVLAMLGGPVIINKNLLKTELPIFSIATIHFIASVYDGMIDRIEALLLVGTLTAYLWYLFSAPNDVKERMELSEQVEKSTLATKDVVFVVLGIVAVLAGAHFTVEMAVNIATGLSIPLGLISIGAIAIGTSLPELFVSLQAIKNKEVDLAIGNIFGSNAFNILLVVGLPGLLAPLVAGEVVMELGLVVLLAASLILFVNGLASQIQKWEGVMMILFFVFFMVKLIQFV